MGLGPSASRGRTKALVTVLRLLHGAGAHDPQAVVEPERVLDGVAFVLCSDLRRARQGDPDGQRVLLACVGSTLARPSAQPAPPGLLSAPAHATGCTEPQPASASRSHAAPGRMDVAEAAQRPPATPLRRGRLGPPLPRPSCLGPPLYRAALPSAKMPTVVPSGTSSILPPAEVSPGAMMLAPDRTKRIAPRSTVNLGRMSGNLPPGGCGEHVPAWA